MAVAAVALAETAVAVDWEVRAVPVAISMVGWALMAKARMESQTQRRMTEAIRT